MEGGEKIRCREEPFKATVGVAKEGGGVAIEVVFHGHYGEPALSLPVRVDQSLEMVTISFNPFLAQWTVQQDEEKEKEKKEDNEVDEISEQTVSLGL